MTGKNDQQEDITKTEVLLNDYIYELYLEDMAIREDMADEIEKMRYLKEIKSDKK